MIADLLCNADLYKNLQAGIRRGLEYLTSTDFTAIEPGRHEIDGQNIYAMVQDYEPKQPENAYWEAHRRYIDIQYVAEGIESIGYAPTETLQVTHPYDSEKDAVFLKGEGSLLTAAKGTFFIFFPQDAHMPGLTFDTVASVRKAVIKILIP